MRDFQMGDEYWFKRDDEWIKWFRYTGGRWYCAQEPDSVRDADISRCLDWGKRDPEHVNCGWSRDGEWIEEYLK